MSFLSEALNALYGSYRLARMDVGGLAYFKVSEEGFWNSFKAAVVVFPLFILLMAVRYGVDDIAASPGRYFSIQFIAYVTGWVALPVVMIWVCQRFERTHYYVRFIIGYNWAAVLQNAMYMPIAILSITGMLDGSGGFIVLVAMMAIVIYTWFIAKTALDIPGPAAAGVVFLDFLLSFTINMYAETLI